MLNIDYESIHSSLRDLVKEYDDMAYQLLINLCNAGDTQNTKIANYPDAKYVEVSRDGIITDIIISFYKNVYETCNIEVCINKDYFDDNKPLAIRHQINWKFQKLDIKENILKGGYAGFVNLNDLSDYLGKIEDKELEIIKSKLEKINEFMHNYSDSRGFTNSRQDDNDIKRLINFKK